MKLDSIDPGLTAAIILAIRRGLYGHAALTFNGLLVALAREPYGSPAEVPDSATVRRHLTCMEYMGFLTRRSGRKFRLDTDEEVWRISRQDELRDLLGGATRLPPLEVDVPPDGGGQGGGGDGGEGGANARGTGDGAGRGGIGEVLAHPVLFALPREDFASFVDQMFTGSEAP